MNFCTTLAEAEPMPQLALCGLFAPGLIIALRHGCMGAGTAPAPCAQLWPGTHVLGAHTHAMRSVVDEAGHRTLAGCAHAP